MLFRVRASVGSTIRAIPLSLLFFLAHSQWAVLSAAQSQEPGRYRISVDVNLVVLHATVTDHKGHRVSGLHKDNFEVYEDGVLQPIKLFRHEDVPVTVGLVVDHSGSMRTKLDDVIAAADTFARASNPGDEMFVVNFNEHVLLGLPAGTTFTADASALETAISRMSADGMTALYDAIVGALEEVREGTLDKKVLVVISDGGDNASKHTLPEVMKMAEESNVIMYAIGLFDEDDRDRNPKILKKLARATGGEAYFPRDTRSVASICEQIAQDIRSQYTLGYTPAPPTAKRSYRKIRVVARAPHYSRLSVRTRAGYIPVAGGSAMREPPAQAPHEAGNP